MPAPLPPALEILSHSPAETQRIGARLGAQLTAGDLLGLSGELGAGKTTFVGGLARGWGALEAVTSPTFVLVNEYQRADGMRLWHLDCYRLASGREALELGLDDLLDAPGAVLIEWPERIQAVLPAERLDLALEWVDPDTRRLRFYARGPRAQALAEMLAAGES